MERTCTMDDCTDRHRARGLCGKHYVAWTRGNIKEQVRAAKIAKPRPCKHCAEPIPPFRRGNATFCSPICKRRDQRQREKAYPQRDRGTCSAEGCDDPKFAKALCSKHYNRLRSKGRLDDVRKNPRGTCKVDECANPHRAVGLCDLHYRKRYRAERKASDLASMPSRTCAQCGALLGPERSTSALFCSRTCKNKERIASGRAAESVQRHYFNSRYGLTPEQVERMAAAGCRICGTHDWPGRHGRPHVDHCHETGRVRGILCSECNTGLGKFKDNPTLLAKAVEYLTAPPTDLLT